MGFKHKRRWRCLPGQQPTDFDKQIMYWENRGKLVPTRELIKTPEQIEGIRRAGVVNTGVLDEVAAHIHIGMSTLEIDQICMDYCKKHNATPACLGYEGFPKSVCTSINEVVCHGIPKATDILEEGDIINIDFTTIVDGYYADASRMFIMGETTPEKEQLVRVAKECLNIGMEAAKPWGFVGDIGNHTRFETMSVGIKHIELETQLVGRVLKRRQHQDGRADRTAAHIETLTAAHVNR